MKRTLAILLAIVAMFSTLSGCGSSPSDASNGTSNGTQQAGPSRTDLKLSINAALVTTDPQATTNVQTRLVLWQVFEGLTHFNELTGKVDMELAKDYKVSEDGMLYTFTLRDDIYFHNGDPVTAQDVVFSFLRCKDPAMVCSQYCSNIKDARAKDAKTVEIELTQSYAPFLVNCCYIFIVSEKEVKAQGDEFGSKVNLAGTGPYKFTHVEMDKRITLEAFDKYYRGEPSIKTVNFYPITDSSAGVMSFESGDLDWYNCTVKDYERLVAENKYGAEMMTANHITFLVMNPNSPVEALRNEKVRQAIAWAINKEEMNMAAFKGFGNVADYMNDPERNVAAPKGDVVYSYNVEKAKALLKEAGYPDGVYVGKILCFTGSHFEVCATVLQSQLDAAGIKADLEWAEQSASIDRARKSDYDMYVTGSICAGDYDDFRKRFYSSQATTYVKFKESEYDYEWMDMMIDKASGTVDPAERLALNKELNDYIMNTATYIPLLNKCVPFVWNKNLNVVNRPINYLIREWSWK